MMPEWREFARRPMMAAIVALGGLLSVGASAPQSQTLSFALSNIYVPSYEDDSACPSLSLGTTDIFVQGLPPEEREVYSAPEKIQELRKLMAERMGFKMVSTGHPSGANGEMTQVPEAELVTLRSSNGIPPGKGTLSFLGTRFAYDSCTNPEDFPMFATGNVEYRGKVAFGEDLDGKTSAEDYRGVDGSRGIDNQLIRATGCNFATRDFGSPKLADNIITSQGSPTLLEISG
ncbi:MAG: hypothetical protein PHE36_12790, partial [Novosphingobium sp.]|nr:hypothetical protein [Novosphingobium sp.]